MKILTLVRLELLKIWKRPLTWIVIGLGVVSVVGTIVGAYRLLLSQSLFDATSGDAILLQDGIVNFIFPGVLTSALGIARTVGSWLLIIFTAIFIGMEDAWGTLRVILSSGISRSQYLWGKLGALLAIVVAFVLVAIVTGSVTAVIIQNSTSIPLPDQSVNGRVLGQVLIMAFRVIVALYIPVLLTFCATILSRSQVTGIAIGLGYFLFEAIMKNVFNSLGAIGDTLRPLLIGYDVATIMALNDFNLDSLPELSPSVGAAWTALALYGVLFLGVSWLVFSKRDITSARGS